MALDPLELLMIAGVVVVLFLWGPSKIPEIARSIGRARKEFDSAQKEFQRATKEFQDQTGLAAVTNAATGPGGGSIIDRLAAMAGEPAAAEQAPAAQPPQLPAPASTGEQKSADQVLLETARQLGITTEGRTREEISQEILAKAKGGAQPAAAPQSIPT